VVTGEEACTVYSVAFSKENVLASGSTDNDVKLWDIETGALVRALKGHSDWVAAVAFGHRDNILASAGDRTVKLWDMVGGVLVRTLKGHSGKR